MLSAYWEISCSRRESQIASFITPRSSWKYKRLPLASYVRWPTKVPWRKCLKWHLISIIHTQQPGFSLTDSQRVWILEFLSISWSPSPVNHFRKFAFLSSYSLGPWNISFPPSNLSLVCWCCSEKENLNISNTLSSLERSLVGGLIRHAWSISSCMAGSAFALQCHLALQQRFHCGNLGP